MLDDDYFKNKEEKYTLFESDPENEKFFPIYDDEEETDETEQQVDDESDESVENNKDGEL